MLGRMRKRSAIYTFEDTWFLQRVSRMSAVVGAIGLAVVLLCAIALSIMQPDSVDRALSGAFAVDGRGVIDVLLWVVWIAVFVVASLIAHELVHGMLFKLFAPRSAHVSFGLSWKHGMLYTSAEGIVYTRRQYIAIALAPTLVVTLLIGAAGLLFGRPIAGLVAAVLHLSGCAGDWCYVSAICADPHITHCEDTSYGVCFYGAGSPDEAVDGARGGIAGALDARDTGVRGDRGGDVGDARAADAHTTDAEAGA